METSWSVEGLGLGFARLPGTDEPTCVKCPVRPFITSKHLPSLNLRTSLRVTGVQSDVVALSANPTGTNNAKRFYRVKSDT